MTMPATLERVHQVAQRAVDLDRAVAFYRDVLRLPFIARFDPPGLAFFDLGNVRLLLEAGDTPPALLYFEVDDIDATVRDLRDSGVDFVDTPHCIHRDDAGRFGPPGTEEWMVFLRDSENNLLGLVERRPAQRRSE
jgi:methylmalonyl-CoA/ethylmalonyl-CoA epimerase